MKLTLPLVVALLMASVTTSSFADHRQPPRANPWAGSNATAGVTLNTGDTVSQNINAGLQLFYKPNKWHNELDATFMRATTKKVLTDKKIDVTYMPSYYFLRMTSVFLSLEYQNFKNDGYDYVYTEILGVNHDIYSTSKFQWSISGGPGLSQYKVQADPNAVRQNKLTIKGKTVLNRQISKSTGLNESLDIRDMRSSVLSTSVTKLTTQVNSKLSAQLQYTFSHNNKPGVNKHKNNSTTQFNLVFNLVK